MTVVLPCVRILLPAFDCGCWCVLLFLRGGLVLVLVLRLSGWVVTSLVCISDARRAVCRGRHMPDRPGTANVSGRVVQRPFCHRHGVYVGHPQAREGSVKTLHWSRIRSLSFVSIGLHHWISRLIIFFVFLRGEESLV